MCLKANKKLSVLRSVRLLSRQTLDLLYKLTVRSVVDYALPVYYNSLRISELARLEKIQYQAGKLVTGAYHYTSKEKLNLELGWETIKNRGDFLSLNFFQKIHRQETRPLIRSCMPKLDIDRTQITRSKGGYIPFKYKGKYFDNSFFPNTVKMWNSLDKSTQYKECVEFKLDLKLALKPPIFKHFKKGSKLGNKLITRIRVGRSNLNQHKFTIGLSESPECMCHYKTESPEHYFLDCFLYLPERRILFDLIEHYVPFFNTLNKKKKLDLILRGVNLEQEQFLSTNITLTKAVQTFIISTKRFAEEIY